MEIGDAKAILIVGTYYDLGDNGFPQSHAKAIELYHRAAELGNAAAYFNIGNFYNTGRGIVMDKKKAKHYYELAAMGGNVKARHNLGSLEAQAGNFDRSIRHHMIAVENGHNNSLKRIQRLYSNGNATKDDYTVSLQAYQEYLGEIKSVQRDKAAAADDTYKYY